MQTDLFGPPPGPALPDGMVYQTGFLSPDDEAGLLQWIGGLPLREARYKAYTARRRVVHYGAQYDYDDNRLMAAEAMPAPLLPLRDRIAAWAGLPPADVRSAMVAEYRPGTPLGWHRDVPDHEVIVGVSLGGTARMRLRPYEGHMAGDRTPAQPGEYERRASIGVITLALEPRSIYVLRGPARWAWQHCIMPTPTLRHSITFRTPS